MHLHAAKYHAFDCIGVLIGRVDGKIVTIENTIPLFHQRVQTGTTEIAFDMIQNIALKPNQRIVGLYEAALPINLPGGKE